MSKHTREILYAIIGSSVLGVIVVIIFKTEQIECVQTHMRQKNLGCQTGCPTITIDERMDDYELSMKESCQDEWIDNLSIGRHKRYQILYEYWNIAVIWWKIGDFPCPRIIDKYRFSAKNSTTMLFNNPFHDQPVNI